MAGIVIDLSAVTFMDGAALGVIAGAHNRLCRAGGWVAVAAASAPVARMFRDTGLDQPVTVHTPAGEAPSAAREASSRSQA